MVSETGDTLYQWRRAKGLTQREIASQLGVNERSVRQWESGAATPRKAAREAIEALTRPPTPPLRVIGPTEALVVEIDGVPGLFFPLPGTKLPAISPVGKKGPLSAIVADSSHSEPVDPERSSDRNLTTLAHSAITRAVKLALQRKANDRSPLEGGRANVLVYVSKPQAEKLRRLADQHRASVSEVVRAMIDVTLEDANEDTS